MNLQYMSSDPVVLVVEDRAASRETRVDLLKSYEFTVFGAANAEAALQQVHSAPSIDLIVTDINLDPNSASDKSGVALARSIRAENSTIPIIGYSAWFSEGDLRSYEKELFNDYLPKGASLPADLEKSVVRWRDLAVEHRKARMAFAATELGRLRTKYNSPKPDFATLLLLRPESEQGLGSEEPSAEDVLSKAGYQLRIVEPGTSRPVLNRTQATVISPLIVWVKREDTITIAEVYGYPQLYAFGDTEDEAITEVLLLMDGFHKELVLDAPSEDSLSTVTRRLRDFLKHVFG